MPLPSNYEELRSLLATLALTQPRILALFLVLPVFNAQLIPGLLRWSLACVVGLLMVPVLHTQVGALEPSAPLLLALIAKEALIGLALGYLAAIPFWVFEAVGFLIDNQRGASIASTLNPLTGNDTSPLGLLCNQAFIVFFMMTGGMLLLLGLLYDSFALWGVAQWWPHWQAEAGVLWLGQLDRLVRLGLLLAAPALVAMFLVELGLALVSRFAPQLQVFFMAMPLKSALAMLVLMLYATALFEHAAELLQGVRDTLPWLQTVWTPGGRTGEAP